MCALDLEFLNEFLCWLDFLRILLSLLALHWLLLSRISRSILRVRLLRVRAVSVVVYLFVHNDGPRFVIRRCYLPHRLFLPDSKMIIEHDHWHD